MYSFFTEIYAHAVVRKLHDVWREVQITYIVTSVHDLHFNVLTVDRLHFRVRVFCKYAAALSKCVQVSNLHELLSKCK